MELKPSTIYRQNCLISFQYLLYYNNLFKRSISKQRYSQFAGYVTKLCKRANASSWARSQLRSRLQSSNDFNRRQGVAKSITVPISAVQTITIKNGRWRRWDVDQSPFTVVDTGLCGRRPPLLSKAPRIYS